MALVSPGIQISINDQSQYVNSNVGSIPLVVLATAQDKTYNGAAATGTSKANAGKLQTFTSQRDLITALGTPTFQLNASGTPINASELNEYGLLTAYSALGLTNQLYAIRADIDLGQLVGTSVRPVGPVADGTYWLNLASTEFGIYALNSATNSFNSIDSNLIIINNEAQVSGSNPAQPLSSVGQQGQYALVFVDATDTTPTGIALWYKATAVSTQGGVNGNSNRNTNTWLQVGSTAWQNAVPALQGTVANPVLTASSTLTINTVTVTMGGSETTVSQLAADINALNINGVTAIVTTGGLLTLFATSAATSNGSTADGKLIITDGTNSPLYKCGLVTASTSGTATAYCPYLFYGNYAQYPAGGWFTTDPTPRPTGSIWWKTTSTGGGWNPVFSQYSAAQKKFNQLSVPLFASYATAIYGLDPTGGGINIEHGQVIATFPTTSTYANELRFFVQLPNTVSSATTSTAGTFTSGQQLTVQITSPGSATFTQYSITTSGSSASTFVSDLLNANIPYLNAQVNSNGTITVSHTTGGQIVLIAGSGGSSTVLTNAGFTNLFNNSLIITNWSAITAETIYSATTPAAEPLDGTLWYYSNPADVDIMINNNGWKGYRNISSDARGYNLTATDPTGVIVSTTATTSQVSGAALVAGDLWLNSSDLVNYPNLSRYNGTSWVAINNTDHTSNNGIIFADARWDTSGTTDPATQSFPAVSSMLLSNYIDQDAPDYRLYPRGALLFNTRRSGFNVKQFKSNYFNSTSFPNPGSIPGSAGTLPNVAATWVSVSGNNQYGVMYAGSAAQRNLIVTAMESAINSNTDILDSNYGFNLLVAPNYPELIPSLVTLNDNRGDTGFIIGDTPMTLQPTATELTNWNNNSGDWAGKGLSTASPYLAVYYPAGLTTDLAGNTVAVPASHAALRTYLYNDQVAYQWFAPAGVNRGHVSNLSDIGYVDSVSGAFIHNGINQGLRDALYTLNINPITQLPGTGLVVWGQETRSGDTTARNRVNVVRLENYLRKIFASVSNSYLFEPNDAITRKSIATQIESALNNVMSLRGLYDYLVICDTSNNTSSVIANNQLYVDVAIEPMKDVEFIYIPIAIYNPGTVASLGKSST